MCGNKLLGIPTGSSPIKPEECAPMGLKYLRFATRQFLEELKNRNSLKIIYQ